MSSVQIREQSIEAPATVVVSESSEPRRSPLTILVIVLSLIFGFIILGALALMMFVVAGRSSVDNQVEQGGSTVAPALAASEPNGDETVVEAAADPVFCSAVDLGPASTQAGLPAAVAEKRSAIVTAATGCATGVLASMADPTFIASFGGGEPDVLWATQEGEGLQPLWHLVQVMDMPYGTVEINGQTTYVWPEAHAYGEWSDVPAGEREALSPVYSTEDLATFDEYGGYLGYRVGIDQDGNWLYFVAGD